MYFYVGLLDSTALWGALAFLACVIGLGIEVPTLFESATDPAGFHGWLYAVMSWSVVSYPILMALHLARVRLSYRKYGPELRSRLDAPVPVLAATFLWSDFTNAFRGITAFSLVRNASWSRSGYRRKQRGRFVLDMMQVVTHCIWTVALWGTLTIGGTYLVTTS